MKNNFLYYRALEGEDEKWDQRRANDDAKKRCQKVGDEICKACLSCRRYNTLKVLQHFGNVKWCKFVKFHTGANDASL